jgi:ABC-type lipoprotein export system ATPase subunit
VVVTHDETLARAARRVIHMRDGVVERDEAIGVDEAARRATRDARRAP